MLQIYCGDGKGKTTAAVGAAVRAAGAGLRVCIIQFMKGAPTSELAALERLPITVRRCDRDYGFYKSMSDGDKAMITRCHNELLESAFSGNYEFIVLDELCSAYRLELLDKERAERLILDSKDRNEIIITGREPPEVLLNAADYISEIRCCRHPYERGVKARRGIEF